MIEAKKKSLKRYTETLQGLGATKAEVRKLTKEYKNILTRLVGDNGFEYDPESEDTCATFSYELEKAPDKRAYFENMLKEHKDSLKGQ